MRIAVLILGVILTVGSVVLATGSTQAQGQDDNVVVSASRSFLAPNMSFDKTIVVLVMVIEYRDADVASDGMEQFAHNILRDEFAATRNDCPADSFRIADPKEISAPRVADESTAIAGKAGEEGEIQGQVAFLLFRQDEFVYVLMGGAIIADPLNDIISIADRLLDEDRPKPRAGSSDMRTGGIWNRLPTLSEVPPGLAFNEDEQNPHLDSGGDCEGTPASSPAA